MVHQDIGCCLRGALSGSDGEHVGPTTEAIDEQQDIGVASWRDTSAQRAALASNRHANNARRNQRTAIQQRRRGRSTL